MTIRKWAMLCLCLVLLASCGTSGKVTVKNFFKYYLNMDVPKSVSNFTGNATDMFPDFLSSAYVKYKADQSYFETLTKHDNFIEKNAYNEPIHLHGNCPSDVSYWTKEKVNTLTLTCYSGVFFPYIHHILYDPKTGMVYHFVSGMRD